MNAEDKIYRALQKRLDRLPAGFPAVKSGRDICLLKRLFTTEEAKIATNLSMKPESLRRIYNRVKKRGLSVKDLETLLDHMAYKGTILITEVDDKKKNYSNAVFSVGGIYNFQVDRLTEDLINEYWQYQSESRMKPMNNMKANTRWAAKPNTKRMLPLRTIPIEKSISLPDKHGIGSYDNIRKMIQDVPGRIAVANCICRQSGDILGKPCSRTELRETCLIIGAEHARRHVDMGIGRYITKEEASGILKQAQEAGLVLQPENTQRPEAICCCCGDCCVLLKQLKKAPRPADFYVTNYYAEVNSELCNGCELCIQRCQLDARTMVNGKVTLNLDRCIGCGNCVTVCAANANRLLKKTEEVRLLKDKDEYNMALLSSRIGKRKILIMKTRMFLGLKV